jgi:hypothetical protein
LKFQMSCPDVISSMAEKSSISTWVMGLSKNAVYPFKWSLNRAH